MATLEELEANVTLLENIEQIKKLQRVYGYYVNYGKWDKIVDLFSEDAESVEVCDHGVYLGKEGVRKFFIDLIGKGGKPRATGVLSIVIQMQGVVDVDPGGKTAKGRWQGWMIGAGPAAGIFRQTWGHGVYENEYIKEDGKWKFKKLHFNLTFRTPYEDGWLKTPVIGQYGTSTVVKPDAPPTAYHPYPSGYHVPYHWKQNITNE